MKIKRLFTNERFVILVLGLVTILNINYLIRPGFYEPHDLHHLADIYQMYRAILSGQIPPRWGPDFLYLFGYPLFNFYYVFPFYLGSIFYFLTGSLTFSFKLVFVFGVLVGAFYFYHFLRKYFSALPSLVGSVLFTFTPYKAVQIYVRGAMGEFLCISFMPALLYFWKNFINTGKRVWFIASVLVSVLIILSHNYFWVLIFVFTLLFFLFESIEERTIRIKKIAYLILQFFLSLGITSYWWLPALIEQNLLKIQTPFPLIDHFPFIKQLILPSWGYGSSVWGEGDGLSFQIGLVNIFSVLFAVVSFLIVKKKNHSSKTLFFWSIFLFFTCIFFMNIRSYFIWKLVPFHNLFQFPWRLLAFCGLSSSILAAYSVEIILSLFKNLGRSFSLLIILASIFLSINYFRPSNILYKSDQDYLRRMFALAPRYGINEVSQDYNNYSEDYLLLPKWVSQKPNFLPPNKFLPEDENVGIQKIRENSPINWEVLLDIEKPGNLNFYSLYFPGWNVIVDGRKADYGWGDLGQIIIRLRPGDRKLNIFWSETPLRNTADYISLFFILVTLIFSSKIGHDYKKNFSKDKK